MTTGEAHGELWSQAARDWARFVEPHYRPLYTEVHQRLGAGNGTRLLDVGCGPGGAALLAHDRGARVAGLDAAAGTIELARERVPDGEFQIGDMETHPWPDESFDAVTGFNSFQFAGNTVNAFTEARRVLVPGGKLGIVVWTPAAESQRPKVMAAIAALAPAPPPSAPGPFALSAPGALESTLQAAGLRVLDGGKIQVVLTYPTVEAACQEMMVGGGTIRAIRYSGEERVRQVMRETIQEFQTESGDVRITSGFRFVIAQ